MKVSVNDILVQALAKAAEQCGLPQQLGASSSAVDVAVAVASERGLITPIVKAAEQKGLLGISQEIKELAGKAKAGTLQPHEFQGGTVTYAALSVSSGCRLRLFLAVSLKPLTNSLSSHLSPSSTASLSFSSLSLSLSCFSLSLSVSSLSLSAWVVLVLLQGNV